MPKVDEKKADEKKPNGVPTDEVGLVVYKWGDREEEIKLSVDLVKKYVNPHVTREEALAFIAYCRANGLNPYTREAYLVKYEGQQEPATPVTAYDVFMKRAESFKGYKGFRAGIVVMPQQDLPKEGPQPVEFEGETDVVPKPFRAVIGTICPPLHELVGGWAKVRRDDRDEPFVVTIAYTEYVKKRRDGTVTKFWREMPATMCRKVAIARGFHDAFPSQYLLTDVEVDPQEPKPTVIEVSRDDVVDLTPNPEVAKLFERLGWNVASRDMFLGQHRRKTVQQQIELLLDELQKRGPEAAAEPEPERGICVHCGETVLVAEHVCPVGLERPPSVDADTWEAMPIEERTAAVAAFRKTDAAQQKLL